VKQAEKIGAIIALLIQLVIGAIGYGQLQANVVSLHDRQVKIEDKLDRLILMDVRMHSREAEK
jgi:hypothetical protein